MQADKHIRDTHSDIAMRSRAEQIAFNEGVMCASFVLGDCADAIKSEVGQKTLDRIFNAMSRARFSIPSEDNQ